MIRLMPLPFFVLGMMILSPIPARSQSTERVVIPQMGISLKLGEPLSPRALVQQPASLKGIVSWSIESRMHAGILRAAALSPDGELMATGGADGNIRVWDVRTGKLVHCLVGHDYYIMHVAWSPDGQTLASTGSFDNSVRLWDRKTGAPLRILKSTHGYTDTIAWSHDGKIIAVGCGTSGAVTTWDLPSGKERFSADQGTAILALAFSRDNSLLACAVPRSGAVILDIDTGKSLEASKVDLTDITTIIAGAGEKDFWVGSAKQVQRVEGGKLDADKLIKTPCVKLTLAPKGDLLITSTGNATTLAKAPAYSVISPVNYSATGWTFTPDGETLFGAVGNDIVSYSLISKMPGKPIAVATGNVQPIWQFGRPLILGVGQVSPTIWDVNTGKSLGQLDGHKSAVTAIATSIDGKQIATGSADFSIRLWDATTAKEIREYKSHKSAITHLAYASDGRLASAAGAEQVRIWPAKGGLPAFTFSDHLNPITALAWSKDGTIFATGDENHEVRLYNPTLGKLTHTIAIAQPVRSLAFAPTGKLLAVGARDHFLRMIQPIPGKLMPEIPLSTGSPPDLSGITWKADGTTLFLARANYLANLFATRTNQESTGIRTMGPPHISGMSSDGRTVMLGTPDGAIRLYDGVATGITPRLTMLTTPKTLAVISSNGYFRTDEAGEAEIVFVTLSKTGMETLTPAEFAEQTKRKNQPGQVKVLSR